MVEHTVQNDMHVICLRSLHKLREVAQITQDRIDLCIIRSVISVA